jgi:thioredoxin reductase
MFDVIIIGGSYAGIAAALQLARARRKILIIDGGQRRNRFVTASHGFLGQDGQDPGAIAAKGKAEVLAYPTAEWREGYVSDARREGDSFVVRAGTEQLEARRIILATGVVDELPPIEGLAEQWGKSVFSCPYCDGYERQRGRLGVLATSADSARFAVLVSEWAARGGMTLFLNGLVEPEGEDLDRMNTRDIRIERAAVVAAAHGKHSPLELRLADGRAAALDGLFLHARTRLEARFAEQLGCAIEEGRLGPMYKTDMMKETTVPGVFACGDAALPVPSVSFAVADGARAGTSAHQSLVFR